MAAIRRTHFKARSYNGTAFVKTGQYDKQRACSHVPRVNHPYLCPGKAVHNGQDVCGSEFEILEVHRLAGARKGRQLPYPHRVALRLPATLNVRG